MLLSFSTIAALIGIVLVVASGTPLPLWFFLIAISLLIAWLAAIRLEPKVSPKWTNGLCVFVALAWASGALAELPYHMVPLLKPVDQRRLYLFGDSLSAGLGEKDAENWPEQMAKSHDLEIANYSRAGATVAKALQQANNATIGDGIVLLEIGGNDLFESTSSDKFAGDLEKLLQRVCQPGRQVVMFELPIPPLKNAFGRAQRRLAAQYGVLLIPKRILISVIASDGSTLDTLHLSKQGHKQMAETVWRIIHPAYARPATDSVRRASAGD
jgi:acyl-CoA thioesterase-1